MEKVRFATIGRSGITRMFIEAARQCPEFVLQGVYSRRMEQAKAFGREYGAVNYYDSLETLAADDTVDAVYIASPNSLHYGQAMRMLRAGKHVLCEKALAANAREAAEMVGVAKAQGVILLEAMRVLYDPGFLAVGRNLHKLGSIRQVNFHFGKYSSKYDDYQAGIPCNIFSPEFAAGGLMDIGIYCVEPMVALFGKPQKVTAGAVLLGGAIDGAGTILAEYEGMVAELSYSKITDLLAPCQIAGESGTMLLPRLVPPRGLEIVYRGGSRETVPMVAGEGEAVAPHSLDPKDNMRYEAAFFIRAAQAGVDVSRNQQISLDSLMLMDEARRQMGVVFPADRG